MFANLATRPWPAWTLVLGLLLPTLAPASTIPKPADARSWILVNSGDCDDDGGNNNVDRGHCVGAVNELTDPSDIGHGHLTNYEIHAVCSIGPDGMRGYAQVVGGSFTFLDMSMIDTYTVHSTQLADGEVVPITVNFRGTATVYPQPFGQIFGGGTFEIRVGPSLNPTPIVIPENLRVGNFGTPQSTAQYFKWPNPNTNPIPVDLLATHTMNITLGTPFDLAFYLGARPSAALIDFTHTGLISFELPAGASITSTGGYGLATPVQHETWGRLRTRYR